MSNKNRTVFAVVTALASFIGVLFLGMWLDGSYHSSFPFGPSVENERLTSYANWKHVCSAASMVIALAAYGLTFWMWPAPKPMGYLSGGRRERLGVPVVFIFHGITPWEMKTAWAATAVERPS